MDNILDRLVDDGGITLMLVALRNHLGVTNSKCLFTASRLLTHCVCTAARRAGDGDASSLGSAGSRRYLACLLVAATLLNPLRTEDCAMSIIDKDEGVDGLQVVSDALT